MTAGHCGFKRSPVNNIEVGRRKGKEEGKEKAEKEEKMRGRNGKEAEKEEEGEYDKSFSV